MDTDKLRESAEQVYDIDHRQAIPAWRAMNRAADTIDNLRAALGYVLPTISDDATRDRIAKFLGGWPSKEQLDDCERRFLALVDDETDQK